MPYDIFKLCSNVERPLRRCWLKVHSNTVLVSTQTCTVDSKQFSELQADTFLLVCVPEIHNLLTVKKRKPTVSNALVAMHLSQVFSDQLLFAYTVSKKCHATSISGVKNDLVLFGVKNKLLIFDNKIACHRTFFNPFRNYECSL